MANMWFYFDLIYNYFLFNQHNNVDTHPAWDLFGKFLFEILVNRLNIFIILFANVGTFRIMRLFKLFNHLKRKFVDPLVFG